MGDDSDVRLWRRTYLVVYKDLLSDRSTSQFHRSLDASATDAAQGSR
jgi:hypothetical protein